MWQSWHLWDKGFCRKNLCSCPVLTLAPCVYIQQIISQTIQCSLSRRFEGKSLNSPSVLLGLSIVLLVPTDSLSLPSKLIGLPKLH